MTTHVRVSGTFKEVEGIFVNVSGTWKEVTNGYVNVSGTWKEFYAAAPAGLTTIVQQASAQSTAEDPGTIIMPVDVQAGDFALLLDRAVAKGTPAAVVPSGFTSIVNTTTGTARQIASYKILDGSEAEEVLTGMSVANGTVDKALVTFRGNVPITSVTPSTPNAEATTGNPDAQSVLASGGTPPLVVLGCYGSDGAIDPRTFTPAKDGELNSGDTNLYLAWKIYNSSPADVSIDMDDEGDGAGNTLQSFYLACA